MAFVGKMNVAVRLIGAGVGVAVSGSAIWLKRPQYTEHALLLAVGTRFANTIWRFCAG